MQPSIAACLILLAGTLAPAIPIASGAALQTIGITGTSPVMTWEDETPGWHHPPHVMAGLVPAIPILKGAAFQTSGMAGRSPVTTGRLAGSAIPKRPGAPSTERGESGAGLGCGKSL